MLTPKVSIILTTFNRAHLIGETLDSILAQTFKNWECYIIDDNSTDNTFEYLKANYLHDERITYHKKKLKNYPKGLSASRNMGMDLINKTDYIQFFDDDDIMHFQKLELQVKEFDKHKNLDFSFFNRVLYDDLLTDDLRYKTYNQVNTNLVNDIAEGYYYKKYYFTAQSPLFRFSYLSKLRFNEELFYAEEWELFLKLFFTKKTTASFIKEPLYFHRNHTNSITTNLYGERDSIKGISKFKAFNSLLDYIYNNNFVLPKRILLNILVISISNERLGDYSFNKIKQILIHNKSKFKIQLFNVLCFMISVSKYSLLRRLFVKTIYNNY